MTSINHNVYMGADRSSLTIHEVLIHLIFIKVHEGDMLIVNLEVDC